MMAYGVLSDSSDVCSHESDDRGDADCQRNFEENQTGQRRFGAVTGSVNLTNLTQVRKTCFPYLARRKPPFLVSNPVGLAESRSKRFQRLSLETFC